jgi:hypothetical protein
MSKFSAYIVKKPSFHKLFYGAISIFAFGVAITGCFRVEYWDAAVGLLIGVFTFAELKTFDNYEFRLENPKLSTIGIYQIGDIRFIARSDLEAELYSELYADNAPVEFIEYVRTF